MNPITELLKAGRIVGLDPKEMTAIALAELAADERALTEHKYRPVARFIDGPFGSSVEWLQGFNSDDINDGAFFYVIVPND